jgi:hypothetical protein
MAIPYLVPHLVVKYRANLEGPLEFSFYPSTKNAQPPNRQCVKNMFCCKTSDQFRWGPLGGGGERTGGRGSRVPPKRRYESWSRNVSTLRVFKNESFYTAFIPSTPPTNTCGAQELAHSFAHQPNNRLLCNHPKAHPNLYNARK